MPEICQQAEPLRCPRLRWLRRFLRLGLVCLGIAVSAEAGRVLFGTNFHTVVAGRVYRSAQPSSEWLLATSRELGIRTVVNLRGCGDPLPEYLEESRATRDLDICQEDVRLASGQVPPAQEIRRLVETLDHAEYPILLHCRRGSDRTGLACAVYLLLYTDTPLAAARHQLGLRYGHLRLGRPGYLDEFLDFYESWLAARGSVHSADLFRHWIVEEYCPGECRCDLEFLDMPAFLPLGQTAALHIRAHNRSIMTWHFRPGTLDGIHAGLVVLDSDGNQVAAGRAGLFRAEVAPGESIDLTMVMPALHVPGRYRLWIDLGDERHCWFYQAGSEPLEREIDVR